jgi:hypothetical protein
MESILKEDEARPTKKKRERLNKKPKKEDNSENSINSLFHEMLL